MEERERSFGEEGSRLSYGTYLRVDELLSQQVLASDPPAHDELLFITIHQVYELWFKQLLHELEHARDGMLDGETYVARHALGRCQSIERVLVEQVAVLETMTPQDFLVFRSLLAPASGFQSVQFREIEFISGRRDPSLVARLRLSDAERARLDRRATEPSLWEAYLVLLSRNGLPVDDDSRLDSLLAIARDRASYGDLWDIGEGLVTHDELIGQWRARHVDMVERQIGTKSGTGGSTGGPYLRRALGVRFFPELWEMRSYL